MVDFIKNQNVQITLSDLELQNLCTTSFHRGRKLKLRKKKSLFLFGFLVHETGGHALLSPEIGNAISESGFDPDVAVDQIVQVALIQEQVAS